MAFNRDKALAAAAKFSAKNQHDRAAKEYLAVIEADPSDIRSWLLLADALKLMGDTAGAIERFLHVGKTYTDGGEFKNALAVYRQVLQVDSGRLDVQSKVAHLYKELGRTQDAIATYEFVAQAYFQAGQIAEGLEGFRMVAELDPGAVGKRLRLAELYSREGMVPQAVEHFRIAADKLFADRRIDDYIRVAERLIYHKEDDLPVLRSLARIYLTQNENRRALVKLNALLRSAPADPEGLELLADTFVALGKQDKSVSVLQELAREQRKGGRKAKMLAARVLKKAIGLAPENVEELKKIAADIDAEVAAMPVDPKERDEDVDLDVDVVEEEATAASSTDLELDVDVEEVPSRPFAGVGANLAPSAAEEPEENVGDIDKLLLEVRVYVKYRMFEHALGHLDSVFVRDSNNVTALELQASILETLQRNQEAADTYVRLAQLVATRDPKLARENVERALRLSPNHTRAEMVLTALEAGGGLASDETAPLVRGLKVESARFEADAAQPTAEPARTIAQPAARPIHEPDSEATSQETGAKEQPASTPPTSSSVAAKVAVEAPEPDASKPTPREDSTSKPAPREDSTSKPAPREDSGASAPPRQVDEAKAPLPAQSEDSAAGKTPLPGPSPSRQSEGPAAGKTPLPGPLPVRPQSEDSAAGKTPLPGPLPTRRSEDSAAGKTPLPRHGEGVESAAGKTPLPGPLPKFGGEKTPLPRLGGEKTPLPVFRPPTGGFRLPVDKPAEAKPDEPARTEAAPEPATVTEADSSEPAARTESTPAPARPTTAMPPAKPGPTGEELEELEAEEVEELEVEDVETASEPTPRRPEPPRKGPPVRPPQPAKRPPPSKAAPPGRKTGPEKVVPAAKTAAKTAPVSPQPVPADREDAADTQPVPSDTPVRAERIAGDAAAARPVAADSPKDVDARPEAVSADSLAEAEPRPEARAGGEKGPADSRAGAGPAEGEADASTGAVSTDSQAEGEKGPADSRAGTGPAEGAADASTGAVSTDSQAGDEKGPADSRAGAGAEGAADASAGAVSTDSQAGDEKGPTDAPPAAPADSRAGAEADASAGAVSTDSQASGEKGPTDASPAAPADSRAGAEADASAGAVSEDSRPGAGERPADVQAAPSDGRERAEATPSEPSSTDAQDAAEPSRRDAGERPADAHPVPADTQEGAGAREPLVDTSGADEPGDASASGEAASAEAPAVPADKPAGDGASAETDREDRSAASGDAGPTSAVAVGDEAGVATAETAVKDAAPAADAWPDITDEIEELRFFIASRFEDDAQFTYLELHRRFPDHPALAEFADRFATGAKIDSAAEPVVALDAPAPTPPPSKPPSKPAPAASPAPTIERLEDEDEDDFLSSIFGEPVVPVAHRKSGPQRAVATFNQNEQADPQAFFDLGMAYHEMGLIDDAMTQFELAAADGRWNSRAKVMIADLRILRGELEQAVTALREATGSAADDDERDAARYRLAEVYLTLGDTPAAMAMLRDVSPGYRDRDALLAEYDV